LTTIKDAKDARVRPGLNGTVIRGAAGTYAVCFELSRRGWLVVPTYGNAPGIDLFASKNSRTIGVQVKTTMRESDGWMVPKMDRIRSDVFYIFVAAAVDDAPKFWALKGSEVPALCDGHPKINVFHFRHRPDERAQYLDRWRVLEETTPDAGLGTN